MRSTMHHNSSFPRFTEAEFSHRYAAIREAMRAADLAALILCGTTSAYHEVLYLSNFITTRETFLVFPGAGEPTLFIQYFNHIPNARQIACIPDVRWGGPDTPTAAADNLVERGLAESRIGLVGPISFKQYESLRKMLQRAIFVDFSPQLLQLRLIKSEEEIAFLRKGAE